MALERTNSQRPAAPVDQRFAPMPKPSQIAILDNRDDRDGIAVAAAQSCACCFQAGT